MNLPNKLTIFRMIMIVPFVVVLLWGSPRWDYLALAIFIVASLTDAIDGHIARKHHLITNFGKFMDPLADKLLVSAAMVVLVALGRIPAWIVIVILSREFIISGFRQVAADQGIVIAASYWGKWKTVFQMVMICLMIADFSFSSLIRLLTDVVMWAALALTVISMIDYLIKNKGVMAEQK